MYCHAWKPIPGAGVNVCTRPKGHRPGHLDEIANVGWTDPVEVPQEAPVRDGASQ